MRRREASSRGRKAKGKDEEAAGSKDSEKFSCRLYLLGGSVAGGKALDSVERLTPDVGDPKARSATGRPLNGAYAFFEPMPSMPRPCWAASAAGLGNRIYYCGGYDGQGLFDSTLCYDTAAQSWETLPTMSTRRSQAAAVAAAGKVFVCGGFNGYEALSSVECFDPEMKAWGEMPPMSVGRVDPIAAAGAGGRLYVCGGADKGTTLKSVEALNLKKSAWKPVAPMLEARRAASAAAISGQLWVCGGHSGLQCLSSVEAYNFDLNQWTEQIPMLRPRYNCIVAVLGPCVVMEAGCALGGGKLYVCGGHDGSEELSSLEYWDPDRGDRGEWTLHSETKLGEPRFMAAGAVHAVPLSKPPPPEEASAAQEGSPTASTRERAR